MHLINLVIVRLIKTHDSDLINDSHKWRFGVDWQYTHARHKSPKPGRKTHKPWQCPTPDAGVVVRLATYNHDPDTSD